MIDRLAFDRPIIKVDEVNNYLQERRKVEDRAMELIGHYRFEEAIEILNTID